mmetsp:Transcript_15498/g.21740  ORF Transcript_15498/g.21740 Transcript_15498/m.21740 type:complete len:405 (-) Transcript_15498:1151-2365(-)
MTSHCFYITQSSQKVNEMNNNKRISKKVFNNILQISILKYLLSNIIFLRKLFFNLSSLLIFHALNIELFYKSINSKTNNTDRNRIIKTVNFDTTKPLSNFSVAIKNNFLSHISGVNCIGNFLNKNNMILSGGLNGKIKLWDFRNKVCLIKCFGFTKKPITHILSRPDSNHIIINGIEKKILVLDPYTFRKKNCLNINKNFTSILLLKNNPNILFTGCSDGNIYEWDLQYNALKNTYKNHLGKVTTICPLKDKDYFISASEDKTFGLWKVNTTHKIKKISRTFAGSINNSSIPFLDSSLVCHHLKENKIIIATNDLNNLCNVKQQLNGHIVNNFRCDLMVLEKKFLIISGDIFGKIHFWLWNKRASPVKSMIAHKRASTSLLSHYSNDLFLSGSWDGYIKIWQFN